MESQEQIDSDHIQIKRLEAEVERLKERYDIANEHRISMSFEIQELTTRNKQLREQLNGIDDMNNILLAKCGDETKRCQRLESELRLFIEGCKQLINCSHQEHFVTRLNDEEMKGIDMIKKAIEMSKGYFKEK